MTVFGGLPERPACRRRAASRSFPSRRKIAYVAAPLTLLSWPRRVALPLEKYDDRALETLEDF